MATAASNYRQVRVTVTQEAGGWITARVMVKPVDASWSMRDTVWHHRWRTEDEPRHWLQALYAAVEQITGETLPGHIG